LTYRNEIYRLDNSKYRGLKHRGFWNGNRKFNNGLNKTIRPHREEPILKLTEPIEKTNSVGVEYFKKFKRELRKPENEYLEAKQSLAKIEKKIIENKKEIEIELLKSQIQRELLKEDLKKIKQILDEIKPSETIDGEKVNNNIENEEENDC
jgi:hypothetical protein